MALRPAALLLPLLLGGPAAQAQEPAARATLEQQLLPDLDARRAAATARAGAAARWFAGEERLAGAFPELDGAPLDSVAFLQGRALALDRAGQARAAARVAAPPAGLGERDLARFAAARAAALDAEEAADALERRLLLALLAGLERAPELRLEAIAGQRAVWAQLRAAVPTEPGPDRDAALAAAEVAGRAEAALARLQRAAWRAMAIPGDPVLAEQVEAELDGGAGSGAEGAEGVTSDAGSSAAAEERARRDRLRRVRPLLDDALGARVDAVLLQGELGELRQRLPALQVEREALATALATPEAGPPPAVSAAEEALAEARAALQALPAVEVPADGPELPRLRAEVAAAERARAQLAVQLAEQRLERARRAASDAAALTEADVDDARRRADESQARASAADTQAEAKVRSEVAALQRRVADELEGERARHAARQEALQARAGELDLARAEAEEAVGMPILAAGRAARIDGATLRLQRIVTELRNTVASSREELTRLRAHGAALGAELPDPSGLPEAVRADVAEELALAVADIERLHATQRDDALRELDRAIALLTEAKAALRAARPHSSDRARDRSLSQWAAELRREALEAPIIVEAGLRRTWRAARELPARITDVDAVVSFVTRSFELVLLAILWMMLRRNAEGWTRRALQGLWRQQQESSRLDTRALVQAGWMVDGDVRAMVQPLAPLLFSVVDLSVAWVLFGMTRTAMPTVALLVQLWLARSLVRAAPRVVPVLFAPPDAQRPALRVLSPETLELLGRSARIAALAVATFMVLHFVALGLFEADYFADLVALGRLVLYAAVSLWLLSAWAPTIRAAVRRTSGDEAVVSALAAETPSAVVRVVRAAGGLGYLAWRGGAEALVRLAEGREGLGWLASALARARLRTAPAEASAPIGPEARAVLLQTDLPVPRPNATARLGEEMAAWWTERRRGLVAVIAPQGGGKREVLAAVEALAAERLPGVPVTVLDLEERTHDPVVALRWLARATGLDEAGELDEDTLIARLSAQPPRVLVVPAMHRLALRAVGGFGAVQAVMRVMQATGEEHFWVCAFHRATWGYLAGVASSANLQGFRARIEVEPLGGAELGAWARQRVAQAGYTLSFRGLLARGIAGPDEARGAERAEQAFWRLLSDASLGVAEVAWGYLVDCLRRSSTPGELQAHLFSAPSQTELERLPDLDLFVLTAVVIHEELDSVGISEVLNAPLGQVLEACRHLDGLGVLDHDDARDRWHIRPRWRPAVERILRQKHFLYMR